MRSTWHRAARHCRAKHRKLVRSKGELTQVLTSDDELPPRDQSRSLLRGRKGKGERMTIFVRTLIGEIVAMETHASDTLENVKAALPIDHEYPDLDIEAEVHFMQKKPPWLTLADCNTQHGDALYVAIEGYGHRVFAP